MALVFGEAYEEGSKALRLILVGTFLASHSLFYSQTLSASGQEVRLAWGLLGNVIFNVLLNLYLIPRHGALGAAVAALLTEMTYYLTLVAFAWKTGPWLPPATVAWVFAGVAVLGLLTFTADFPTKPLVGSGVLVLVLAGWAVFMVRKRPDRLLWRPTL
jgi:O-antigen/teichoic acid export membrane protein